jgi:hypothetical protein
MEQVRCDGHRTLPDIFTAHFRAVCIDEGAIRKAISQQHHEDIFENDSLENALKQLERAIKTFNGYCESYAVGTYFPARPIGDETRAKLQRELDEYWKELEE